MLVFTFKHKISAPKEVYEKTIINTETLEHQVCWVAASIDLGVGAVILPETIHCKVLNTIEKTTPYGEPVIETELETSFATENEDNQYATCFAIQQVFKTTDITYN